MASFFSSQSLKEIPFQQEIGRRSVPWIISLLIFLLTILLMGSMILGGTLYRWQAEGLNKITIEIPLNQNVSNEAFDQETQHIIHFLKSTKGVITCIPVEERQMLSLLQPWVGEISNIEDFKLPVIIDIEVDNQFPYTTQELLQKLKEYNKEIHIEEQTKWHNLLRSVASNIRIASFIILFFITLTVFIIISLATRSSIHTHKDTINVLHLLGARKSYIAKKFQKSAFSLCFKGSIIGLLSSFPVILFVWWVIQYLGIPEFYSSIHDVKMLAIILSIPFFVSVLGMLIARMSVFRLLSNY